MNFINWMTIGLLAFVVFSFADAIAKNVIRFFAKKKASHEYDLNDIEGDDNA